MHLCVCECGEGVISSKENVNKRVKDFIENIFWICLYDLKGKICAKIENLDKGLNLRPIPGIIVQVLFKCTKSMPLP